VVSSGRSLPFLRRAFRAGSESTTGGHNFPETGPVPRPATRTVFPPLRDNVPANGQQLRRKATSSGGSISASSVAGTTDSKERSLSDTVSTDAAGNLHGPDGQKASTNEPVTISASEQATGREGKIFTKPNPEETKFSAGRTSAAELPSSDTGMTDMSTQIIKRHQPPSPPRKLQPTGDNFHFLQGNGDRFRSISASHQHMLRETPSARQNTVLNRKTTKLTLHGNDHKLPESRVSRQAAEITGKTGNHSENPRAGIMQPAGKKSEKDVGIGSMPVNELSGSRMLLTAPLLTREQARSTGSGPLLMRAETDKRESPFLQFSDFQLSGSNSGQAAGRWIQRAVALSRSGEHSSSLPLPRSALTKTADTMTEPAGTGALVAGSESAYASSLLTVKADYISGSCANINAGLANSIFRAAMGATRNTVDAFLPLTARGNSGIMEGIFRRRSAMPFAPGMDRLQTMQMHGIQSGHLSGFPLTAGSRQGPTGNVSDSHGRETGYSGHPCPPLSGGQPRIEPANAAARMKQERQSGPRKILPLINRKEHADTGARETGSCDTTAAVAGRHDANAYLQRTASQNGGTATSTEPAANSSLTGPTTVANPAVSFDLERIADEVYHIIERRLIAEKERKGL